MKQAFWNLCAAVFNVAALFTMVGNEVTRFTFTLLVLNTLSFGANYQIVFEALQKEYEYDKLRKTHHPRGINTGRHWIIRTFF